MANIFEMERRGIPYNNADSREAVETMNTVGWHRPIGAKKWHYYKNGRSLCRKYGLLPHDQLQEGEDVHSENCLPCQRKLES